MSEASARSCACVPSLVSTSAAPASPAAVRGNRSRRSMAWLPSVVSKIFALSVLCASRKLRRHSEGHRRPSAAVLDLKNADAERRLWQSTERLEGWKRPPRVLPPFETPAFGRLLRVTVEDVDDGVV